MPGPFKSWWHLYFFCDLFWDTRIIPPFSCIVSEVSGVYWIHCPTTPPLRTLSREDTLAFFDLGSHTLLSMSLSSWGGRFQKLFIWDPYLSILPLIPPSVSLFLHVSPHLLPTESFKKHMLPAHSNILSLLSYSSKKLVISNPKLRKILILLLSPICVHILPLRK